MTELPDECASQPLSDPAPEGALLRWIKRKGLATPATVLLEMHRPLMPLAWSAAMVVGPFLAPLLGPDYYEKIEALRDPRALDRILARLQPDHAEDTRA